jgi:hypothetical protein
MYIVPQRYLLDRIPARYSLNGFEPKPEPAEVRKARKTVERWDKAIAHQRCVHDKRIDALVRKARESVYFDSEEKALAIIRQVEKMLKSCTV